MEEREGHISKSFVGNPPQDDGLSRVREDFDGS